VPVELAVNEIAPLTAKSVPGVVVPMPTLPLPSIMKTVVVPEYVVVETAKNGEVLPFTEFIAVLDAPAIERSAHGDVEPMPMNCDVAVKRDEVPTTD